MSKVGLGIQWIAPSGVEVSQFYNKLVALGASSLPPQGPWVLISKVARISHLFKSSLPRLLKSLVAPSILVVTGAKVHLGQSQQHGSFNMEQTFITQFSNNVINRSLDSNISYFFLLHRNRITTLYGFYLFFFTNIRSSISPSTTLHLVKSINGKFLSICGVLGYWSCVLTDNLIKFRF